MSYQNDLPEPLVYSINEACRISSLGRTRMYQLIRVGDLKATKVGKRTLVSAASLKELLLGSSC